MRRRGDILLEVLVALIILGLILPSLFSALGVGFLGLNGLRAEDERLYGAQWWFDRLPRPVRAASLSAMPRSLPEGGVDFSWSSWTGTQGEVWVTLEVRSSLSGGVLVRTRAF